MIYKNQYCSYRKMDRIKNMLRKLRNHSLRNQINVTEALFTSASARVTNTTTAPAMASE